MVRELEIDLREIFFFIIIVIASFTFLLLLLTIILCPVCRCRCHRGVLDIHPCGFLGRWCGLSLLLPELLLPDQETLSLLLLAEEEGIQ